MITPAQATLFDRLMRDGATVAEATLTVQLATAVTAIELSFKDAWKHELRDDHGRFTSGGGGGGKSPAVYAMPPGGPAVRIVPKSVPLTRTPTARAATQGPRAAAPGRLPLGTPAASLTGRQEFGGMSPQAYIDNAIATMQANTAKALEDMTAASERKLRGQAEARAKYLLLKTEAEARQAKAAKAHHKFAVEAGVSIGGLVLALVEGAIGAPGLSQILAAMAGPVVQAIIEWRKRL